MRTPYNFILFKPLVINASQSAQCPHGVRTVEDVVYQALEIVCVVGEADDLLIVSAAQVEAVSVEVRARCLGAFGGDIHFLKGLSVAAALEVWVVHGHCTVGQVL